MKWREMSTFSAEIRLLLLATRPGPRPAPEDELRACIAEGIDWDTLAELAARHRGIPALYQGLVQAHRDAVPPATAERMRQRFVYWAMRNLMLTSQIHTVLQAFRADGIEALCLKGLAIGALAYGDPILRETSDLDLLVRRDDFARARAALVACGYRPDVSARREEAYLREHHGFAFRSEKGDVDLHWNLAHLFQRVPTDADALLERSLRVPLGSGEVPTLSREDHLLQLATHGVTHCWRSLYLIADIAALLQDPDRLDWDLVKRNAAASRSRRAIALSVYLAVRLYAAVPPEALREELADPAIEHLAAQVQQWLFVDPKPSMERFVIHRFYLGTLDGWEDRAAYLADMARRGLRIERP